VALAERRPLNITLSLDTSGSMSGEPIELIRQSCLALAHSMGEGDVVSMVTWNDRQEIILDSHAIAGPDDEELVAACRQLDATGTTDLHSGLVLAYELARRNFNHERINRVILMSDGGANTGITDIDLIAQNADDAEGEAIYMMGVGMASPGSYQDGLMDAVTDAGKGAYIYIDSAEEAQLMFGERLLSNVEIAARDVRVELTLPPTFSMAEFHGEEYSEDPEEVEPQHLAPNDAMIYHQIVRSCDQSSLDMGTAITVRATYETPFTREPLDATLETNLGTLLTGDDALLVKGNAVVAYAQALADRSLAASALDQVQAAIEVLGADPDLLEIEELLTLLGGNGD
jgi:Ca-activated chloride channel family protein